MLFFNAAPLIPSGVAALSGEHFLSVELWDPQQEEFSKKPEVWHGVTDATSRRHLKALVDLQKEIRESDRLKKLSLAEAILWHLDSRAQQARVPWLPSTHFRELTNLEGAFSSLGKYATNLDFGLNLNNSSSWKNAKKAWSMLSMQHQPVHQTAANAEDIAAALSQITDPEIRVFIMLLWLMCARKGDIARLRAADVTLDRETSQISFFVQEGKGVKARQGKYHVVSHCPAIWLEELSTFIDERRPKERASTKPLFSPHLARDDTILQALRLGNPTLSCRSVRRGALQTIAATGVEEDILMRMSGHKSVATLHRYLDWDRTNKLMHDRAQEAARALDPARAIAAPQA